MYRHRVIPTAIYPLAGGCERGVPLRRKWNEQFEIQSTARRTPGSDSSSNETLFLIIKSLARDPANLLQSGWLHVA